ncbi:Ribonucleases P/MRP protein subunit pop1, partial [Teratosphaeriaceae sp. CCFEE 6253]
AAGRVMPSQKAVNRRNAASGPGEYPEVKDGDPSMPVLLFTSSSGAAFGANQSNSGDKPSPNTAVSWTLLAPWKCLQPIWYSLMYYPLSTGQQPRFGGLDEKRQILFEAGSPWFPADFPGTQAGWLWEMQERRNREEAWRRRPKGKRVNFEKVEVGEGKREVGVGWACEWERLVGGPPQVEEPAAGVGVEPKVVQKEQQAGAVDSNTAAAENRKPEAPLQAPPKPPQLAQLSARQAQVLLDGTTHTLPPHVALLSALMTVRLRLLTRGVPQTCARIYCLPSASSNPLLRRQWLALLPSKQSQQSEQKRGPRGPKHSLPRLPKGLPPHVMQQRLAQSLLAPPRASEDDYPKCPGEEDLVGFVTTGNFNLGEGKGTGVGSLLVERVLGDVRVDGGRWCIVRNAGSAVGRLARWDVA